VGTILGSHNWRPSGTETMVDHLHKILEAKVKISMVRVIIRDLHLECKVVRMWRGGSSIHFVDDGLKDMVMVVVIVGETILRTNVVNRTRSLPCLVSIIGETMGNMHSD
jgi:hypothetical protein